MKSRKLFEELEQLQDHSSPAEMFIMMFTHAVRSLHALSNSIEGGAKASDAEILSVLNSASDVLEDARIQLEKAEGSEHSAFHGLIDRYMTVIERIRKT